MSRLLMLVLALAFLVSGCKKESSSQPGKDAGPLPSVGPGPSPPPPPPPAPAPPQK